MSISSRTEEKIQVNNIGVFLKGLKETPDVTTYNLILISMKVLQNVFGYHQLNIVMLQLLFRLNY